MEGNRNCAFLTEIEALVSDYLRRKSSNDHLAEKTDDSGNSSTLTLEEVYKYYRNHHANVRIPKETTEVELAAPAPGTKELPLLHPEIHWHISKFLEPADFLNLRFVNSNWSKLASQRLRRSSHSPIRLKNTKSLRAFVSMMSKRGQEIPFGTFKFYFTESRVLNHRLLAPIGIHILRCILKFSEEEPQVPLSHFIKFLPNLEHLQLEGEVRLEWIHFETSQTQSSIQSFQLRRGLTLRGILTLETVMLWISQNPRLRSFKCDHPVELDSGSDFLKFLNSIQHLRTVHLRVKFTGTNTALQPENMNQPITTNTPPLKLRIDNGPRDNILISHWLMLPIPNIRKLSFLGPGIQLNSVQNKLETINLNLNPFNGSTSSPGAYLQMNFPILKRVIIEYQGGNLRDPNPFRGNIFTTVEILHLKGAFNHGGVGKEDWAAIFPNVLNFRIEGAIYDVHLRNSATIFPNLHHLNISSSAGSTFSFSQCIVAQIGGFNSTPHLWPLGSLKELKKLEFVGYNRNVLLEISILCKWDMMPQLEYLGFFKGNQPQAFGNKGKDLFKGTPWDKKIQFGRNYNNDFWRG